MPTYNSSWRKTPSRRKPKASVPGRYGIQNARPKVDGYLQRPSPDRMVATPPPRPAAPKPPPAKPPGPQGLPFDPTYESTVGGARRQYDTTNAGLTYQEGRVKQDYGFGDDPLDPFSKARMLERNFHQATRGRLNTAGNNLYSSSFNRGEEVGRFNYEGDVNTTRKSYTDLLQGYAQQRAQALTDKTGAEISAGADRIARAQENREDPGPPTVAAPAAKPKAKPKPKPKAKPKAKKHKPKKPGKYTKFSKPKVKGYR